MKFEQVVDKLRLELNKDLPGESGQMLMSPLGRATHKKALELYPNPTPSAILIAIYPRAEQAHTLYMVRNSYDGHHSGQISFPGGKVEPEDLDLKQTALREFREEMGLEVDEQQVIGGLSPLIVPPSGFIIHPFVAVFEEDLVPIPDESEVAGILQPSLHQLLHEETKQNQLVQGSSNLKLKAPSYVLDQHVIWGATAMITSELEVICKRFLF